MYLELRVTSKNKQSIKNFLYFFFEKNLINIILNKFNKKNKIKKFTILKAPHVNKTAQEQFEYRLIVNKVNWYVFKTLKFLILIKNIQNNLFSDIKIEINIICCNINKKIKTKLFSPDKYKNNNTYLNQILPKLVKRIKHKKPRRNSKYLKMFDIFGETVI